MLSLSCEDQDKEDGRMETQEPTLLLISGPVGVGKTTIANELSVLLEADDIPHTFVDLDALTYTFPRPDDDPYGDRLALENLRAVWANARLQCARNLIIPRVVETATYPGRIAETVGIDNPVVCRLTASDKTLLERVRMREKGSGRDWHEKRALQLSFLLDQIGLEDFCISTDDRTICDVAREIKGRVNWCRN